MRCSILSLGFIATMMMAPSSSVFAKSLPDYVAVTADTTGSPAKNIIYKGPNPNSSDAHEKIKYGDGGDGDDGDDEDSDYELTRRFLPGLGMVSGAVPAEVVSSLPAVGGGSSGSSSDGATTGHTRGVSSTIENQNGNTYMYGTDESGSGDKLTRRSLFLVRRKQGFAVHQRRSPTPGSGKVGKKSGKGANKKKSAAGTMNESTDGAGEENSGAARRSLNEDEDTEATAQVDDTEEGEVETQDVTTEGDDDEED